MSIEPKVPLLPCPFCGNDKLYAGHAESQVMEVACFYQTPAGRQIKGCGARVRVAKPTHWPKEMPELGGSAALDWVAQWTLDEAVRRWNTRQESPALPVIRKDAARVFTPAEVASLVEFVTDLAGEVDEEDTMSDCGDIRSGAYELAESLGILPETETADEEDEEDDV